MLKILGCVLLFFAFFGANPYTSPYPALNFALSNSYHFQLSYLGYYPTIFCSNPHSPSSLSDFGYSRTSIFFLPSSNSQIINKQTTFQARVIEFETESL